MEKATALPEPAKVELAPQPRERGLDITTGRQPKRLWEGGSVPAEEAPAKTA